MFTHPGTELLSYSSPSGVMYVKYSSLVTASSSESCSASSMLCMALAAMASGFVATSVVTMFEIVCKR